MWNSIFLGPAGLGCSNTSEGCSAGALRTAEANTTTATATLKSFHTHKKKNLLSFWPLWDFFFHNFLCFEPDISQSTNTQPGGNPSTHFRVGKHSLWLLIWSWCETLSLWAPQSCLYEQDSSPGDLGSSLFKLPLNAASRWINWEGCDTHECFGCTSETPVWEHKVDPWSWAFFFWKLFLVSGVSCRLGWPGPSDEPPWNKARTEKIKEKVSKPEKKKDSFSSYKHLGWSPYWPTETGSARKTAF